MLVIIFSCYQELARTRGLHHWMKLISFCSQQLLLTQLRFRLGVPQRKILELRALNLARENAGLPPVLLLPPEDVYGRPLPDPVLDPRLFDFGSQVNPE